MLFFSTFFSKSWFERRLCSLLLTPLRSIGSVTVASEVELQCEEACRAHTLLCSFVRVVNQTGTLSAKESIPAFDAFFVLSEQLVFFSFLQALTVHYLPAVSISRPFRIGRGSDLLK